MAISVDTIYQRVLALANKEQRGYITPQEFNLLANQAQMSIFESYFYAKNQRDKAEMNARRTLANEVDESDIGELLDRKLAPFQSYEAVTDSGTTFPPTTPGGYDIYQTGVVLYNDVPCQKVSIFEAQRFTASARHMLTTPAGRAPIYCDSIETGEDIRVYAGSTTPASSGVKVECFRVPVTVNWAYVVVSSKALYNSALAVDFELHRSEEDTLVTRILELAGIIMNKPGIVTTASQMSANEFQSQNL